LTQIMAARPGLAEGRLAPKRPDVPMTDLLAKYATRAVPRYTSYPTAPHFQGGFPEATYAEWLAALDPAEPVSLYLHVPFCRQMCWYCGCNMKLAARYGPVAAYAETLLAEIDLVADRLPARLVAGHLHLGGGTPTALSPDDLARLLDRLRSRFDFAPDAELAIETDPRTLSDAMIARIGALGFTRASFGVQEFDPEVQAAINRIQPPDMVARAVDGLRAAGVRSVNFDLIYGLPHQTVEKIERTVELAAAMRPDRAALFGYAHVPWMAKNQRMIPEAALPGPGERARQAERAAERFAELGYQPIGLDHFALPDDDMAVAAREGRLHRNFQGYTTDEAGTLLPFGATSIGRTPQGYVQNIAETGAWARAVEARRLPVAKGLALSAEDRMRGMVIERIMCDGRVDLAATGARFGAGADWWTGARGALGDMARDGLIEREGSAGEGRIALTPAGRPLARVVAAAFDAYLGASQARHSVAV
jgi:oxygen-independent coproporphyrinogen III oxidase